MYILYDFDTEFTRDPSRVHSHVHWNYFKGVCTMCIKRTSLVLLRECSKRAIAQARYIECDTHLCSKQESSFYANQALQQQWAKAAIQEQKACYDFTIVLNGKPVWLKYMLCLDQLRSASAICSTLLSELTFKQKFCLVAGWLHEGLPVSWTIFPCGISSRAINTLFAKGCRI